METQQQPTTPTPWSNELEKAVDALEALSDELNDRFPERAEFINCMLNALVSKQHVLSVGPPGVGKSAITNLLAMAIIKDDGASFKTWSYQFNKFVTPDEVFGPMSIKAFEMDVVKRNPKNMLPEADLAVFEEVFKSNSATLNSVLGALNERVWFQEGQSCKIPLRSALMNSNELPSKNEGLAAVVDRIPQKIWVDKVRMKESFESILFTSPEKRNEPLTNTITVKQLDLIYEWAKTLKFVVLAQHALWDIRETVNDQDIYISDRRIQAGFELCKVQALRRCVVFRESDLKVMMADLQPLANVFWNELAEKENVSRIVEKFSQPWKQDLDDANELLTEAFEHLRCIKLKTAKTEESVQVIQKVNMVEVNVKRIEESYPEAKTELLKIERFCKTIKSECEKVVMPWLS